MLHFADSDFRMTVRLMMVSRGLLMDDVSTFAPFFEFLPKLRTAIGPNTLRSSMFKEPTVQGICYRLGYKTGQLGDKRPP